MIHTTRPHSIHVIAESVDDASIALLANKLANFDWCTCQGFRLGDFLFLNDATSEDGAQEYAVLRASPNADGKHRQVESYTCSWMSADKLKGILHALYGSRHAADAVAMREQKSPVVVATSAAELLAALGSASDVNMGSYALVPHPPGVCSRCA